MQRLLILIQTLLTSICVSAQVNIWEGTSRDVEVELIPYPVEGQYNTGIVICPGGSYFWHDMEAEGHDVARWLQQKQHRHQPSSLAIVICSEGYATLIRRMTCCRPCVM